MQDVPDKPLPPRHVSASTPDGGKTPRVIETPSLFGGASEVRIRHNAVEYRLCITRQGKLILTK